MKKALLFFHCILIANMLFAQWGSNPSTGATIVSDALTNEINQVSVSDGANGAIVVFESTDLNAVNNIYAQRINSNGQILWGLTDDPKPVCLHAFEKSIENVIPDGNGGVFIAWFDTRNNVDLRDIYVQHINGSGDPLWPENGIMIDNVNDRDKNEIRLCTDGSGGVIVVWGESLYDNTTSLTVYSQLFAQRYSSDGTAQWGDGGIEICTTDSFRAFASIVPDDAGGAIISFEDTRNSTHLEGDIFDNIDIYAQRINNNGELLWTGDGVAVSTQPYNQLLGEEYLQTSTTIPDGAGGVIILFDDYTGNNDGNGTFYAQHLNGSGVSQWATAGMPVCISNYYKFLIKAVPDAAGGIVAFWSEDRVGNGDYSSYAQRILANGSANWATDGVKLVDSIGGAGGFENDLVADGNGNFIFTWSDTASHVQAQKINGSGIVQWGVTNKDVCTNLNANPVLTRIVKSDAGSSIITWLDNRNYGASLTDIYAAKIDANGILAGTDGSNYITVANGDWNVGATWQGGIVPPVDADVKIRHTVAITANASCHSVSIEPPNGNLTVNTGVNLSILQ
jgi:hypothetical protein